MASYDRYKALAKAERDWKLANSLSFRNPTLVLMHDDKGISTRVTTDSNGHVHHKRLELSPNPPAVLCFNPTKSGSSPKAGV